MFKTRTRYKDKNGLEIGTTSSRGLMYLAFPNKWSNCVEIPYNTIYLEDVDWNLVIENYFGESYKYVGSFRPSEEKELMEIISRKLPEDS